MLNRYRYVEGLTNLVGNAENVTINYLGEIRDPLGRKLPTSLDEDGHPSLVVKGWDSLRKYRVIELVAIQYKGLVIPYSEFNNLEVFVIDGDKLNTQAKNVGYRFKNGPIELEKSPGFYYIPGFTGYAINKDGVIINSRSGEVIRFMVSKPYVKKNIRGGYYMANCMSPNRKATTLGRHRALCLTFKDYPDDVDKMVVNHINGVPGDDRLENLEWMTRGQNNKHAYENDLKNQHMRVLVKHVLTGEVVEYYSISEAARQLNLNSDESIRFRLRAVFGTVFQDGTQVKLKNDPREFPHVEDPEEAIRIATIADPVKSRNCLTGEVKEHSSFVKAGKESDVSPATIRYRILKDDISPLRGFQFMRLDDERPWPDFTEEEYQKTLGPINYRVDARNLLTGETLSFTSIKKAHQRFMGDIFTMFQQGKQPLKMDGWQLKLEIDEWEEVEDLDNVLYSLRREVMAKNVETGHVFIADSANEMSRGLGIRATRIRDAAMTRGKKVLEGYRFKLGHSEPWPL